MLAVEPDTYDIVSAAEVINWVDEKLFLSRLNNIMVNKDIAIFKAWFEDSLEPLFNHKKQTLVFDGYSWYLKLIKENRNE